jgi:hypothetical protein
LRALAPICLLLCRVSTLAAGNIQAMNLSGWTHMQQLLVFA